VEAVVLAILEREGRAAEWRRDVASHRQDTIEAMDLLGELGLAGDANTRTASLPYGRQRLVEIALGLATRPRILLLDEPAAGIPAAESSEVLGAIAALPPSVTVLFIEHDMDLVFRFAQRITVLAAGRILAEGTPEAISRDERVREVYLGRVDG
jgi:branched-chain amino acid transport system ATP-binding protein